MNVLKCKTKLAVAVGLFACLGAGTKTHAATLVLVSLTCHEPEDENQDEPELSVVTRGEITTLRLGRMRRGVTKPEDEDDEIGRFIMGRSTSVILYDLDNGRDDWFDSDDYLGGHTIRPEVTNGIRSLTFNGDGASYTLRFRVIR